MRLSLLRPLPASLAAGRLRTVCDELVAAEAEGFDDVWLASPEASASVHALAVAAADVATRTSRIGVGMVATLAGEGHPLHWAEALIQLDILSQGRARFAGRLADGEAGTLEHAREQMAVLAGAVAGTSLSHAGPRIQLVDVRCHPGPASEPHPPLALAGGPAAGVLASELGLPWLREDDATSAAGPGPDPTPVGVIVRLAVASPPPWEEWLAGLTRAGVAQCVVALPEGPVGPETTSRQRELGHAWRRLCAGPG